MEDRYVSRASLPPAAPSYHYRDDSLQQSWSNHKMPNSENHKIFQNAAQPIHPVLQRRCTPLLRVHHPQRRATQTVSVAFRDDEQQAQTINNSRLLMRGTNQEDDDDHDEERLSCDRTGRQPIPPPRGPAFKIALARNVSHNALRSPRLAQKHRDYCVPRLASSRASVPAFSSQRSSVVSSSAKSPALTTGVSAQSTHDPSPVTHLSSSKLDTGSSGGGYGNSSKSRFYIDLQPHQQNNTTASSHRQMPISVTANKPTPHQSLDEIVDQIFHSIADEQFDTDRPNQVYRHSSPIIHPAHQVYRSKSDATLEKQPVIRRRRMPPNDQLVNRSLLHHSATASAHFPNLPPSFVRRPQNMETVEERTTHHLTSSPTAANSNIMQRMRKSFDNLRTRVNKPTPTSSGFESHVDNSAEQRKIYASLAGFEEALTRSVHQATSWDRGRKVTSADSGIVDCQHDEDHSSSSQKMRSSKTENVINDASASTASRSSASAMRRSQSQPPNRMQSFSNSSSQTTPPDQSSKEEKTSDLDRSVSARSSRTSDLSDSTDNSQLTPPFYADSLWSQVKYQVDQEAPPTTAAAVINPGSVNQSMRSNVILEIVQNERDFVRNLKDLIEGYLYKCRQRSDMFSKGRIECIFGNLESLYEFQCEFLADLEGSIGKNDVASSEIGHCFLLHQRGFSELYSDYCNSHSQSVGEILQLKQLKQYAHFFEACRMLQDMVEISLDGFLLQPIQKICKYPLQLTELLKSTPADHPDRESVRLALEAMKSVTGLINERKRRLECLEKIALWQETLEGWQGEDLVERSSQLIHYGDLNKLSSRNSWTHEYAFFLFDHQLIYCRRDMIKRNLLSYKARFDLNQVEIVDLEQNDNGIKHGLVIVCPQKEHSTILLAKNLEDKARWLRAFREERERVEDDLVQGFSIPAKDRFSAIQSAKQTAAGKERKRSTTKDALKDLTDHTQLVQSMRSKSVSMTLPVRIRQTSNPRNKRKPIHNITNVSVK